MDPNSPYAPRPEAVRHEYRRSAVEHAGGDGNGLKGWIQNMRDGTVEALVEGEKQSIDDWLEELKEGPRFAEVTRIEQESKEFTGKLPDFDVKF